MKSACSLYYFYFLLIVCYMVALVPVSKAAAELTSTSDRVSTGVQAISANPGNRISPVAAAGETFTSFTLQPGIRVTLQMKEPPEVGRQPHIILYLLPNGNTTEQAFGRTAAPDLDWHYGIQHIAAQTRRVRELLITRTVITAVVEADTLSWPNWRKQTVDSDARIREVVDQIRAHAGVPEATIDLIAHSGGGSFIWGFLNSQEQVPDFVQHIVFIDANYSYSDEDLHGEKLLTWLNASPEHRLIVIAYDDRNVKINGKNIVSQSGGTWRATERMAARLERELDFKSGSVNDLQTSTALNEQILLARHPNPENRILHTVLVEKNGFVYSAIYGRVPGSPADSLYNTDEAYRRHILP